MPRSADSACLAGCNRAAKPFTRTTPSLWVAAGLAMGTVVAIGLARFAYSLLLPAMRGDLHWTYAQAGSLNAAISLGYLVGALLTPRAERAIGGRRGFLAGMFATVAGLLATAMFRDLYTLLTLRFLTGIALGPIFICGFSLASRAGAASNRSTLFSSVYAAGLGLGIVLSGVMLPPLLGTTGDWPKGWLMLALLGLAATLLAIPATRRSPEAAAVSANAAQRHSLRGLTPLLLAALLYGAGYFALVTFVIAYLRASGYSQAHVLEFWIAAGVALMVTMPLWGRVLPHFHGGWGVAITNALLIVSAGMVVFGHSQSLVVLASVLFGASVLVSGFSQFDYGRRLTTPENWTRVIAALTAAFCAGQTLGPIFCGWMSDTGGLRAGMFAAIGLLCLCVVAALLQRGRTA